MRTGRRSHHAPWVLVRNQAVVRVRFLASASGSVKAGLFTMRTQKKQVWKKTEFNLETKLQEDARQAAADVALELRREGWVAKQLENVGVKVQLNLWS